MRSGGIARSMPSASSTSALPDFELAARLPCLATVTPAAATTIALTVEMLKLFEPSPPVPHVSRIGAGRLSFTGCACRRIARAAAATSDAVSPFMRSATSNPPICAGVASPRRIVSNACSISAGASSAPETACARMSLNETACVAAASLTPPRARAGPARADARGSYAAAHARARSGTTRDGTARPRARTRVAQSHDLAFRGPGADLDVAASAFRARRSSE